MIRVMIIDEQPLLTKQLFEDFSDDKYQISQMRQADGISERIRAFMPDIILLDLWLSGLERWDILHRIKLDSPYLPVIIVSTYETFAHDPRMGEADGFVIKDIYTGKLENKIMELLA